MRKLMKVLSFCLIIGSLLTTISFAESNVVESLEGIKIDSKTEEVDYNISPMKLEVDVDFDKWESWNKKTNVGMWKDESYVNVWIENQGSSSFTFTVADNAFLTNPIAVETIKPGQSETIRVEYEDLYIDYAGGLYCTVYVQAYSYNNNVVGRLRVAGR